VPDGVASEGLPGAGGGGMTDRIRRRLDKLQGGASCPTCHYRPSEEPDSISYEVEWITLEPPRGWAPPEEAVRNTEIPSNLEPSREPEPPPPPREPCSGCGRVWEIEVPWEDVPEPPELIPDYPPWPDSTEGGGEGR
jgi:hypothetical protein